MLTACYLVLAAATFNIIFSPEVSTGGVRELQNNPICGPFGERNPEIDVFEYSRRTFTIFLPGAIEVRELDNCVMPLNVTGVRTIKIKNCDHFFLYSPKPYFFGTENVDFRCCFDNDCRNLLLVSKPVLSMILLRLWIPHSILDLE